MNTEEMSTILIVCDQLVNYKRLPRKILDQLPGYQAFKRLGIEFTNIYNNRQDCSPSRASFQSSHLDVNIGDNIDFNFQYPYNPRLDPCLDTIGKTMKRNGIETAYYGKNHIDSSLAKSVSDTPMLNVNSRRCMLQYGFDRFNTFGDTYYYDNQGYYTDNTLMSFKVNCSMDDVDYEDTSGKYIGVIPFLKSRISERRPFHLQVHFENPHDTQHFWQNLSTVPSKSQLQFYIPYIEEQIRLINEQDPTKQLTNPFVYNGVPQYASDKNLLRNYFEDNFKDYASDLRSLPFLESFVKDYATDPEVNSAFPFFVGMSAGLHGSTSMPDDKSDIKAWKNLINNYYGLVIMTDLYIYQIFQQLNQSRMLNRVSVCIISDHGEMMSAHGQKQKGQHYDNGSNVPCVIYSPKFASFQRGTVSHVIGSLLDIAPTMEVLANLKTKSTQFQGVSLLNDRLVPRRQSIPVFNIYYSWLTYFTYFSYMMLPEQDRSKVIPKYNSYESFFNYPGFYTMIVEEINGVKYKLARYFNFIELIVYNFVFNPKLQNISISDLDFDESTTSLPMISGDIQEFKAHMASLQPSTLDIKSIHRGIILKYGNNSIIGVLFVIALTKIINEKCGYSMMIPGYYNSTFTKGNRFIEYFEDPDANYYFFMHNLTEDPEEVINLLDQAPQFGRITPERLALAAKLNDDMNASIDSYGIVNFDFIIPKLALEAILLNYKLFGVNFGEYTPDQAKMLTSLFGLNNNDEPANKSNYFEQLLTVLKARIA